MFNKLKQKNILYLLTPLFLLLISFVFVTKVEAISFTQQIPIPGVATSTIQPDHSTKALGNYIKGIYNYGIGIVAILATAVMMFGGFQWIIAGGSAEKVGEAKAWIGASLTGLVLALSSYTILNLINPNLTNLQIQTIRTVTEIKATSSVEAFLTSSDCTSSNQLGLVNQNDPNALNNCNSLCVSSGNTMDFSQSKYYQDGWAYCCYCN